MGKNKNKKKKNRGSKDGPAGSFRGVILITLRPKWKKSGRLAPRSGAELTTRQVVWGGSFVTHTGLTGGSNNLFMVNTGGFAAVFSHALADMPQSSSWTAVFDQYRIEEIEVHLLPITSSNTTTNTATNFTGASQIVMDFDDGTALANENASLEYDNVQTFMNYDAAVVRYKPAVAPAYYNSGAFLGTELRQRIVPGLTLRPLPLFISAQKCGLAR